MSNVLKVDLNKVISGDTSETEHFGNALLKQAIDKRNEEAAKHAVTAAVEILTEGDVLVDKVVADLRSIRKQEKDVAARVGRLNAAAETLKESGNVFPLLMEIGGYDRVVDFCEENGYVTPDEDSDELEPAPAAE